MDHTVPLSSSFKSVQAIEPDHSPARHVAAALANLEQIVNPGVASNPQALVSQIYQTYTEHPDIAKNDIGMTREQSLTYLASANIAFIDMQDQVSGPTFKYELQAQNLNNVVQLLILGDESKLHHAVSGKPLHNWIDGEPGGACSLIRVGYSDSVPNAFYLDASLHPGFVQPVPISWTDIEAAGLLSCIAVMPHGVAAPPADFRFCQGLNGDDNVIPNVWPIPVPPKPVIDTEAAQSTIDTLMSHEQDAFAARQAILTQLKTLLHGN